MGGRLGYSHLRTPILNLILTNGILTPGQHSDALVVEGRNEIVPLLDDDSSSIELCLGLSEHIGLNLSEEGGDGGGESVEREIGLDSVVSSNGEGLTLLDVLGSDFESEGDSLDEEGR